NHEAAASHDVTVQVTDVAGATYDETFTIAVGDVNEGPVAVDDTATTSENAAIKLDVLANDSDPDDGNRLSLDAAKVTEGGGVVSVDDGVLTYDPGSAYDHLAVGESAEVTVAYQISDEKGLTDQAEVTFKVTGSNDGPVVAAPLADQASTEDAAFSFQVPAGSFADLDTSDTLSYSATLSDGSALPAWLSFDASTQTFSGTPENDDVGAVNITVTATDPHGATAADTFEITTANTNDTPDDLTLDNASVDENASDGTVVGTAAGSDVDVGDVLSYSLTDDAGGRFAIDADTGEITVADSSALNHEA
ncbi:MAG: putative Ig domain-containing protein, partial [Geminicoccales bacterium]